MQSVDRSLSSRDNYQWPGSGRSYHHPHQSGAAERLAAHKFLALGGSQRVEDSGDGEKDGRCNQTRRAGDETNPLHSAHNGVHGGAHPVGAETANEIVELLGRRAYAQQERYFNKEDDRSVDPGEVV